MGKRLKEMSVALRQGRFKAFVILALAGFWPGAGAAPELKFERLSLEHGLSQSSVYAMAEGPLGYLWIGTEQGADRFDGYRITTLRHAPHQASSLGHSRVNIFHTDAQGRFWIGTHNGLNRIHQTGLSVQSLHLPDREQIGPGTFNVFAMRDACGEHLLVLSNHGPWLLDTANDRWNSLLVQGTDEDWQPSSHHAGDQGDIWLANRRSLWHLDCSSLNLQQVKRYEASRSPPVPSGPNLLAGAPDGLLLWASERGLMRQSEPYDPLRFQPVTPSSDFADVILSAIHLDQRDRVWGLMSDGVIRIQGEHLGNWSRAVLLDHVLAEDRIHRLESAVSGDGVFWLTGPFGLAAQSRGDQALELIRHDPGNPDSIPPSFHSVGYRVLSDRFGVVWIGANLGGVARYVPGQHRFAHVAETSIGTSNVVRGVIETGDPGRERVWVGVGIGGVRIYERERGEYRLIRTLTADRPGPTALPGNRVAAMARQPGTDAVWVLGRDWLARLDGDPADPRVMAVSMPPAFRSARHLAFSRDGRDLYVTSSEAVWRLSAPFDTGVPEPLYRNDPGVGSTDFTPVLELSSGQLAVGCRRGLNLIDPESGQGRRIPLFPDKPLSTINFVFSLHESANGRLWMGTHGGGLASVALDELDLDNPPIQWRTTADGLADNTVYAVLGDRIGRLWLTGNRGISHFCPDTERVRNFSPRDGLQAHEFNGRVADIGASGRFYFGGINGFNVFRPEDIVDHPLPPEVHLQAFRVNEELIPLDHSDVSVFPLAHDRNTLVFDYVGLHSVAPEAIRYAYRLVGADDDWVDAGDARRARYPNLPPGDYEFQVRAANPDGIWSEPVGLLAASIRPPPWRTTPAYLAYGLAVIAAGLFIAWSVVRRRRQLEALVAQRTLELSERTATVSRQASELENLLETQQALFTNVSHELRTPLTLIQTGLGRLKSDPEDVDALELSERYVHRLDRLVDQLLDLARVRADAFQPEDQAWSLHPWVQQLAQDYAALASGRGLQLDLVMDGGWETRCNQALVEKCVDNLLSNALKYTPSGGQVVLRLTGETDSARIEVSDTGPGIPPDEQASIFERFQRLPAEESQAEKGAGIGLSLVHEAALAMDGAIHLESRPGQGSGFALVIPAVEVQPDRPDGAGPIAQADRRAVEAGSRGTDTPRPAAQEPVTGEALLGRLLIVEDNLDLRAHLEGLLGGQWNVHTASDGHEALQCLQAHDIDIVLSDIMMPEIDGLELLKRIRADIATSHIPFVILTARRDSETRLQGLRLAADAVLNKPFSDQELALTLFNISRMLEARRASQQQGDSPDADALSHADRQFILRVERWLESSFGDPAARISDLADALHVEERTLQRKTRALFGRAPKRLLTDFRLERACRFLRDPDRKVSELAYDCGFASAASFSKLFRQRFGKTPSAWRE